MKLSDNSNESIVEINIAPLVDIILVLLIIFMATAPMIQSRTLNVNVPKSSQSESKATLALNVVVNAQGEILLGEHPVTIQDLTFQLAGMYRADPTLHVAVLADESLAYGRVVEVLDSVKESGVKKVALEVRNKVKS